MVWGGDGSECVWFGGGGCVVILIVVVVVIVVMKVGGRGSLLCDGGCSGRSDNSTPGTTGRRWEDVGVSADEPMMVGQGIGRRRTHTRRGRSSSRRGR